MQGTDEMTREDRYEMLLLLHAYVVEQGTAALHVVDVARDLAATVTDDYFSTGRIENAARMHDAITALLP